MSSLAFLRKMARESVDIVAEWVGLWFKMYEIF